MWSQGGAGMALVSEHHEAASQSGVLQGRHPLMDSRRSATAAS